MQFSNDISTQVRHVFTILNFVNFINKSYEEGFEWIKSVAVKIRNFKKKKKKIISRLPFVGKQMQVNQSFGFCANLYLNSEEK